MIINSTTNGIKYLIKICDYIENISKKLLRKLKIHYLFRMPNLQSKFLILKRHIPVPLHI